MGAKSKGNKNQTVNFKDSVKTKLIIVMCLVVAVPLIISILVSYSTSTNKSKDDALDLLSNRAKVVDAQFETQVQKNVVALKTFAATPTVIEYFQTYHQEDATVTDNDILAIMDQINADLNDGNTSIILTFPSGQQLIRADRNEPADISDREYFQACVATHDVAASEVVVSKKAGNRILIMIVPVFDKGGNFIGTAQRSFDLVNLHGFLADATADGYIADHKGIVAAHATHEISPEDEPEDHSDAEFMTSSATNGLFETTEDGAKKYYSWIRNTTTGYIIAVAEKDSAIMSAANRSAITVIIIGIVLVVIGLIISLIMANSFTNPLLSVTASLSALADGRFDKVNDNSSSRKDEFGVIVRDTNLLIDKLEEIVGAIKKSTATVTSSSEDLADMASQIATTTDGVANAVQEIATGAVQQAGEIQEAAENVGRITDAVISVQNSTSGMESLTANMKEASQSSSKSLSNLQESSSGMTSKIEEIARTISATQDAVSNINDRVEGISGIATQTNLLSLNASIEAARAGEAGKGFAVVAEEIRKLADDSESMAQDIRTEMDILLQQANAAVAAANEVKQGNLEQQEALSETLKSVNGMLSDINSTVSGVNAISEGTNTCVTSNQVVSDAMSSLSAISEENAASSETTGASVQELSATVSSLANSAESLKEIAEQLNTEMAFFK